MNNFGNTHAHKQVGYEGGVRGGGGVSVVSVVLEEGGTGGEEEAASPLQESVSHSSDASTASYSSSKELLPKD